MELCRASDPIPNRGIGASPGRVRVAALRRRQDVKKAFGCTVNDVVMALCAAGLRSWLDERGQLPTEPLLGVIPVSVRTREQMGTFGNQVSAMTVELPTNEADRWTAAASGHRDDGRRQGTAPRVAGIPDAGRQRPSFLPPCSPMQSERCRKWRGSLALISQST